MSQKGGPNEQIQATEAAGKSRAEQGEKTDRKRRWRNWTVTLMSEATTWH